MHNLLDFLRRYNHWLVFFLLEAISMVMVFQYNNYQNSIWLSSANAVAGKLHSWDAEVESFLSLSEANTALSRRNVYLEQQVVALQDKLAKATGDTAKAHRGELAELKGFRTIQAKVVSNSINSGNNLITIDKGEADGVRKDMGVVCGTGVVGIVYLASAHYAVVIPLLNQRSNISCRIQGRAFFGYLHWNGGSPSRAYVEDIPRHARFRLYDHVETSGYSSVFPPGILVGKIIHVYNSPDGVSYRLQVQLSTDFSQLRDVSVIDNTPALERLETLRAAQDSLRIKDDN